MVLRMYVKNLTCVRVKGGESFRIDSDVRQDCIMSPWLFSVYMDAAIKDENGMEVRVLIN